MSDEKVIDVTSANLEDGSVQLICKIDKTVFMRMFDSYGFKETIEKQMAHRIVQEIPVEKLQEIWDKINLDTVAKITTIEIARTMADRNR